jgi:uncharacterized membrane protein YdjX (TVP38/TMEM64 family)
MGLIESYIATIPLPLAVLVSVILSIFLSIVGVIPSAFLTVVNITVFGFWGGFWVSLLGEIIGSVVAFWLYRKGFRSFVDSRSKHTPRLKKLLHASQNEAFLFVIGLRLMPFVPSGLVTLYAAVGTMSFISFSVASSLGKVPALFIETSAASAVVNWSASGQVIVAILALGFLFYGIIQMKKRID